MLHNWLLFTEISTKLQISRSISDEYLVFLGDFNIEVRHLQTPGTAVALVLATAPFAPPNGSEMNAAGHALEGLEFLPAEHAVLLQRQSGTTS